ncbi:MAG TPA: response regulator [Terriglobales bacterium]|nr:response regulator [Terriglobales bacterium]
MPQPSILIVDDNALMLLTLTRILEQHDYSVLGASSASSALQLVKSKPVDLVITDYNLPGGGSELGPALKRLRPKLPLVVLSGDPEAAQAAEYADLLLPKPQEPEKLMAEIRRLLQQRSAEQAA